MQVNPQFLTPSPSTAPAGLLASPGGLTALQAESGRLDLSYGRLRALGAAATF